MISLLLLPGQDPSWLETIIALALPSASRRMIVDEHRKEGYVCMSD